MKRIISLTLATTAFALMVSASGAAIKPRLPLPVCKITGAKYYPAIGRLVGQGSCTYKLRQPNGKYRTVKPRGAKWTYANLTVSDQTGAACALKQVKGTGNSALLGLAGAYKATAVYRLWLPKNRYHQVGRVVVKTVTAVLGGKTAVCSGAPVVTAPEGPKSPTGSGNGGSTDTGFNCGWKGQSAVDSAGVHITIVDCSGNGVCKWVSLNGSYDRYGMTIYPGRFSCSNGVVATPVFYLDFAYADGSVCRTELDGVQTFPLPGGWAGTLSGRIELWTFGTDGHRLSGFPALTINPTPGSGTTRPCG